MSCAGFNIYDNAGTRTYDWEECGTYTETEAAGTLFVFEQGLKYCGPNQKVYRYVAETANRFLGVGSSPYMHLPDWEPGMQFHGEDDHVYNMYLVYAPHEHTFSTEWTADATSHWHKSTCGHDVISDKAKHEWNEGEIITPATPTQAGSMKFTCTVCGRTKTKKIPKLENPGTAVERKVTSAGNVEVHTPKVDEASRRRMQHTTFQSRLSAKMDGLSRKFTDNAIRLSSSAVDMVRVKVVRDQRSHDIITREMVSNEILPIMLPPLKNVPLRYFSKSVSDIKVPSLYTMEQQEYIEIFCPMECNLDEDDLLIRFLEDPACPGDFYTMILQVKEVLANFSTTGLRNKKYYATFFEESLPQGIVDQLKEEHRKHLELGW